MKVDTIGHMSAAAECALVATGALTLTALVGGLGVWLGGGRELAIALAWALGVIGALLYGTAVVMRIADGPAPKRYKDI